MVRLLGDRRRQRTEPTPRVSSGDEAYRVLRSNLLVAVQGIARPVVVITSAVPREGKTSTSVALARSLALSGRRVVLVDFDLRSPDAHQHLGADNVPGCIDVLLDRRPLEECIQFLPPPPDAPTANGHYFVPAGSGASDPSELLGAPRTQRMLDALSAEADIVLLDTPPVLPVADTLVIGRMASGALLVVEARNTRIDLVNRAKAALIRNQTRIMGVVLNRVQSGDMPYSYGYGGLDRDSNNST